MDKKTIPIAIVVAGLLIAGAIFYSKSPSTPNSQVDNSNIEKITLRAISADDHIVGSPDAKIIIVEYSDVLCSWCKKFYVIMEQIISKYASTGKVAWVYRNFPRIPNDSFEAAAAAECAYKLGGNEKYWQYLRESFDRSPDINETVLVALAEKNGLDANKFKDCMKNDADVKKKIETEYQDGLKIAKADMNFGTPYNIILLKDGTIIPQAGAMSFDTLSEKIDVILGQISEKNNATSTSSGTTTKP